MSDLILPEGYRRKEQNQKLANLIQDVLYRWVCQKKTNAQIQALLRKKNLPPMNNGELNVARDFFKQKEAEYPEKMAQFRKRLGVA